MGVFDSVYVPCPQCGRAEVEFQSKADDDCYCRRFTLDDAPKCILGDLDGKTQACDRCGYVVSIKVLMHAKAY